MKALTPLLTTPFLALVALISGCAPEVGSERWCQKMEDTPKGEWTMNDAGEFAKHCLFEQRSK